MKEEQNWDSIWSEHTELNWLGRRLKKSQRKAVVVALGKMKLDKDARIVDVGCGTGSMMKFFREIGYGNTIGIDFSKESLKVCERHFGFKRSKDVFYMDARKTKFANKSFDLVFSDGTIEHLPEIETVAREMCRISRKYIFLFQPNQKSLFGLVKELAFKMNKASWDKEYSYSKSDYMRAFGKNGFRLAGSGSVNMNEMMWLLFRRE